MPPGARSWSLLGAASCAVATFGASAQVLGPLDFVGEDDDETTPLRYAGADIQWTASSHLGLDDNVFATNFDREADAILGAAASIAVDRSDSRRTLSVEADGSYDRYLQAPSQSRANVRALIRTDFRVTEGFRLTAGGQAVRGQEDPGRSEFLQSENAFIVPESPIEFGRQRAFGGLEVLEGPFHFKATGAFSRLNVDDARLLGGDGLLEQDVRDRKAIGVSGYVLRRGRWASLGAEGEAELRRFRLERDAEVFDRDGTWFRGGVFVENRPGSRLDWRAFLGADSVGVEDSRLSDQIIVSARTRVLWAATPLITVRMRAARELTPAALGATPSVRGMSCSLGFRHEVLRNLEWGADVELLRLVQVDTDRRDIRTDVTSYARWRVTRRLAFRLNYERLNLNSTFEIRDFSKNRVFLTLEIRP